MTQNCKIKLGLVQMACSTDRESNLKKVAAKSDELAKSGAQILCLQELFTGPYFCQTEDAALFDLAESIPGPSTEFLQDVAKRNQQVIVASLFEKRAPGLYHNTTAVIDADGSYLGKYRKMHIPDDPSFYEKFYFTPGDLGYKVFETRYAKLGVLICWDQWYPEAARLTALKGAEIIVYPTAIGWSAVDKKLYGEKQYNAWKTIQTGHAVANGVFVASVNRIGTEGDLEFWGGSFVADPFGEILHKSPHDKEDTTVVTCDLSLIEQTRRGWPFLRDRRIDSYTDITKRFGDQ